MSSMMYFVVAMEMSPFRSRAFANASTVAICVPPASTTLLPDKPLINPRAQGIMGSPNSRIASIGSPFRLPGATPALAIASAATCSLSPVGLETKLLLTFSL